MGHVAEYHLTCGVVNSFGFRLLQQGSCSGIYLYIYNECRRLSLDQKSFLVSKVPEYIYVEGELQADQLRMSCIVLYVP